MSRKRQPINHGTYGGYQAHVQRGVDPCEDCREANRNYHRDYLERKPEKRAEKFAANAARTRALWRLADAHYDEFQRLYREEATR